jgi:hypothetical protein
MPKLAALDPSVEQIVFGCEIIRHLEERLGRNPRNRSLELLKAMILEGRPHLGPRIAAELGLNYTGNTRRKNQIKQIFKAMMLAAGLCLVLVSLAHAQTVTHTFTVSCTDNSSGEEGFYFYFVGASIPMRQTGPNSCGFSFSFTGVAGQQFCLEATAFRHVLVNGISVLEESARSAPGCGVVPTPSISPPNAPSKGTLP